MGIMGFLRNRAGIIIVGVIGLAIVAFLIGDAVRLGSPFWEAEKNVVAEIAGEDISIQDFTAKIEENTNNFKQQSGQSNLNDQMLSYVQENTWNQTLSEVLMRKELKRIGMDVGKNEITDMITGKNPDPQIVQAFGDPKTGQVDRNQLSSFLSNLETQDPNSQMAQQWRAFLKSLKQTRMTQKYTNLIKNSLYVTSLEAREDYMQRNKIAEFRYVNLDYASVPDKTVKLTDDDYKEYYNENKFRFKNKEESRSFEYVLFDANPSKTDSAELKQRVDQLAKDFKASTNDSLFVSINSDTKTPISYIPKGQLDAALDSAVFKASSGSFIGPVFSNGSYRMAKVIDVRVSPDSVSASHILLNSVAEGGMDKAKAKADSIKNLIVKGASFAALAKQFGTDGTKEKGGDLGTFARGSMVPAFEEAVFNGKAGDLKVITTQFGVHVVKINSQKGSAKVAKVAVVDKAVAASSKTQQEAYSKASSFLSVADDSEAFDEQVKKAGLKKQVAENITGSQSMVPGLGNPRELIRWAFKADEGDISEQVFETDNKFVIARLTEIRKKGTLPLDKVKKDIEPEVRKKVKARLLLERMDKALAGSSSIEQVAKKLGRPVIPVQNIVLANPILPGVSQENKVVGTVFGLNLKKMSDAIEGQNGVYVVVADSFRNPPPLTNVFKQKQQLSQSLEQRAAEETFNVLKEKADIKDNRVRFF